MVTFPLQEWIVNKILTLYRPYHYPELQSLTVKNVSKIFYTSTLAQKKNSKLIHIFPMKKGGGDIWTNLNHILLKNILYQVWPKSEKKILIVVLCQCMYTVLLIYYLLDLSLSLSRRVLLFTCAKDHLNLTISSKECF